MIKPAISVLSAVDGLKPDAPRLAPVIGPHHTLVFLLHARPGIGFAVLGGAFLALTGAEAMGPIRWFAVVPPDADTNPRNPPHPTSSTKSADRIRYPFGASHLILEDLLLPVQSSAAANRPNTDRMGPSD